MELTERESTVFGLLEKKQRAGMEFSENEKLAFDLIQKKSGVSDRVEQSLDEQRKALGVPIEKDVPPTVPSLREFTFGSTKFPKQPGQAEPTLEQKRIEAGIPVEKDVLPQTAGESLMEFFRPTLAMITAPVTIPANVIVGLIKDVKGVSSKRNVDAIRRIATLRPTEGDELFVVDVLKEFGITDESTGMPEGTIERVGLVGDFMAFGGADKLARTVAKVATSGKPVKTFVKEVKEAGKVGKKVPKVTGEVTEKGVGVDPFRLFKERPLKPGAIGVRVKTLIKERAFNIDKAFLDSEAFIKNFDVKLSRLEREALPFIRQGVKDVSVLKKIGREDLIKVIKNPSKALLEHNAKLGKYYDDAHKFLKENFDEVGFVENYVTQIWDIPKARKTEVLNYFSTHNPFTKKRTIPSLEEGIKLGLKPKTTDISEILRAYDQFKVKTAFNLRFADSLKNMVDSNTGLKVMQRIDKAPQDWVKIDHPALSRAMAIGKIGKEGVLLKKVPVKVAPEIAKEVQAMFAQPFRAPVISVLETINAFTKKSMLSFSFFHHFALTESAFSSGIGKKAISMWNPYKIIRALKKKDYDIFKRMPLAKDSIDHGVTYGALPDFQVARVREGLLSVERATKKIPVVGKAAKTVRTANDLWDKTLWDYYHNTLKLHAYEKQTMRALKQGNKITQKRFGRGMNRGEIEEAKNQVGKFINDSFGGQRWELNRFFNDARNRQMIHWLLLSPDWTFSVLKQAFAPIKGRLLEVGGSTLERKLAGTLLKKRGVSFWAKAILYYNLASQSVNMVNSQIHLGEPRFTWQNDPGHKLDVFAGFNEDGTKRYIRPGKQFREVMEWSYEPEKKLGAKLSPVLREAMRQGGKVDPGSGFPTKFAKQEFFASIPERLKSIAKVGIPFSMRHLIEGTPKNFMFTLPASKGMSNFKSVDLFKKAIRKGDINRISEVYFAALENNLDAQNLFKAAKSSVKADITMDNKKFAKRILGELRALGSPEEQRELYNHYKQRGVITSAIEKIFTNMVKKESSIQRQRESAGIQ